MVSSLGGWNWASLSMVIPANICVHIVSIPPPLGFPDLDILAWSPSVDGNFSVQSAHAAIAHSNIMILDPLFKLYNLEMVWFEENYNFSLVCCQQFTAYK